MKISIAKLKSTNAPEAIIAWFSSRFSTLELQYQDVLNWLAEEDQPAIAFWLLDRFEDDRTCLHVHGDYRHRHVFAAGEVHCFEFIAITGWIRAGRSIHSENSLSADLGIISGSDIRCDRSIRSKGDLRSGGRIEVCHSIDVSGSIQSGHSVIAGEDVRSGGDIRTGTKTEHEWQAAAEIVSTREDDGAFRRAAVELLSAQRADLSFRDRILDLRAGRDLVVLGNIDCTGTVVARGNVLVHGSVHGRWLEAKESLTVKGDLMLDYEAHAGTDLRVDGTACCDSIYSGRHISVGGHILPGGDGRRPGSILSRGDLRVGGDVRSNASVNAVGMQVGGSIVARRCINAMQQIESGGSIEAGGHVQTVFGAIIAPGSIRVGKGIRAGGFISANGNVSCGDGYGIASGLNDSLLGPLGVSADATPNLDESRTE